MPYRSPRQRAYLHVHEPKLAAKWDKRYGGRIVPLGEKKAVRRYRRNP